MPDYMETSPQKWLLENGLNDVIISHPQAGEQYVQYVSDALKTFAKLVIEHTVETTEAHSDGEIDKDGAIANSLRQFGLL